MFLPDDTKNVALIGSGEINFAKAAKNHRLSATSYAIAYDSHVTARHTQKIPHFYFQGLGHGTVPENNSGVSDAM